MARTVKKETALTAEEKLAQALVPEAEQPYRVLENWCWIYLGSISVNQYGYTAKAVINDELPKMLRITDIQESGVDWNAVPNCEIGSENKHKYLLQDNDIVIARTGATTGKSYILFNPTNAVFASYLIRLRINAEVSTQYIYKFLQSNCYWNQISELSSGIAQPGVNSSKLQLLMTPLPPLTEQQRIVDRIESLFAKLDEAKEKAQAVVDGFEDRKAAILHKAFTGELTKKWRECHNQKLQDWVSTLLKDCSNGIGDGLHGTPVYDDNGQYWFINGNNLSGLRIEYKPDTKKVGLDEYMKYMVALSRESTVLLSINGTLGKTAFYNGESIILGKSACYINTDNCLDKRFLRYYFMSKEFIDYANSMATGSTIKNLGLKAMRNMPLSLPSIDEQNEIVRILDDVFEAEQQAKEAAEQVIDQIDTMKKSILARAFRGELGTNDPTDESAEELLKRVL